MLSRIAGPFSGAVTRQPRLETKFCLTWTVKSEQSKTTNALCLILLIHTIFWKPCQILLFQQNLAQNLDYQSASPLRPHKHSFSPSRVLIHFYPAHFHITPHLVLEIHVWQMIWWDSNNTWMNPHFSARQKCKACKNKKKSTLPFAEINLQRMVNSEISWAGRINLHWISSSISHSFPHGSKIHHCWNSTDGQKNKIVKHHETLTHWVAQTAFSFYPSLEVAISYFRKYTYYSLKFKGLGPLLKSWNWYTLSTSKCAWRQCTKEEHGTISKITTLLLCLALLLRCDGTSVQKQCLDTPYLYNRTLLCNQSLC